MTVATQADTSPHKPGSRSRARALVALVVRFDLGGVCRKIVTSLSGSPPLLPAGLQPRPRPAGAKPVSQSSRALRIWMIGTTLRLDGAPLSQFELARGLVGLGGMTS